MTHPATTPPVTVARDPVDAALSAPPSQSTERDRLLLNTAEDAGASGQALSVLQRIDLAGLNAHDRVRFLKSMAACAAWVEAMQSLATAAVAGPSGGWVATEVEARVRGDVAEFGSGASLRERERIEAQARDEAWEVRERAVTLEVSMAMRVSPRTAGRRIHGARFLLESLRPAVGEALAGRWGYGHLRVAEKELESVPAPLRERVFADVVPHAAIDHPRRLTDRIRKSLARHDAAGSAERMKERAAHREVTLWNLADGQARLAVTGPFQAITEAHRRLTELARAHRTVLMTAAAERGETLRGEDSLLSALRVDALLEAIRRLEEAMDAGTLLPGAHASDGTSADSVHSDFHTPSGKVAEADPWTGPRVHAPGSRPAPQAAIIIDLPTALGMADEPGFVPGYGWVPAPIARELLADSDKWRRWLIDDESRRIIEAGSTRYRPSRALRDLVAGRDLTCTADTCSRPASDHQLDHAIDFDGTNTSPDNVHGVCGPDHLVITAGHFVIDTDEAGNLAWVSTETGHSYPSYPDLLHERRPTGSDGGRMPD
ncbi:MAG: DUF222 domain-containing protein [Candidatus Nanopelagicales bacterium]